MNTMESSIRTISLIVFKRLLLLGRVFIWIMNGDGNLDDKFIIGGVCLYYKEKIEMEQPTNNDEAICDKRRKMLKVRGIEL